MWRLWIMLGWLTQGDVVARLAHSQNFTTLWIDGNHENFDMLYQFPLEDRFGGKVRQIAPDIYHLDRGQVLTIDGRKIFCMGGARSVDKAYRTEHISWWQQEMPSNEEMERAVCALEQHNWTVDFVVTHCAPRSIQTLLASWYENDPMVSFWNAFVKTFILSGGTSVTTMWTNSSTTSLSPCTIG